MRRRTQPRPFQGPTLVLRRGEPVEITLVNRLTEATAIHWHGMELDSYYDGVHGWSGLGTRVTPLIEPGETFVVRFTPPRTGTFIYHTHLHDHRQLPVRALRRDAGGRSGRTRTRHLIPRLTTSSSSAAPVESSTRRQFSMAREIRGSRGRPALDIASG